MLLLTPWYSIENNAKIEKKVIGIKSTLTPKNKNNFDSISLGDNLIFDKINCLKK